MENSLMTYNSNRKSLIIPEYGRYIHEMIGYCKTIEDKEKRNHNAQAIIEIMGNMNPHLRDVPDFQHKLWDQLFIMAEFDLDVDSPFPKPTEETLKSKPEKMPYPKPDAKFRYYGKFLKEMIEKAKDEPNEQKREGLAIALANQMKKSYVLWNRDSVTDELIFKHLSDLSDGVLKIDPENVQLVTALAAKKTKQGKKRGRK